MLTCVAGSVDALSFFGLGGVFTSLLSGNTIVLAAYLVQGHSARTLLGIFVFVGYLPGEALATYLLRKEKRNTLEWTKRVTQTLGIEALLALVVGTYFSHNYPHNSVYGHGYSTQSVDLSVTAIPVPGRILYYERNQLPA